MSSSRLVRGAKTRMFACICIICVLGAVVYVFHGTQTRLADVQKLANSCNQQQESLSAQLQVIFEYKLRLEKSLKKEKSEHAATKEMCKTREKDEREARQNEKIEASNKYESLVQQCKLQKSRFDDEKEAYEKNLLNLKDEKKRLETALDSAKEDIQAYKRDKEGEIENLKGGYLKLQEEIKKLKDINAELNAKPVPTNERLIYLEKQNQQLKMELSELEKITKDCKRAKEGGGVKEEPLNKPEVNPDNTNALEAPKFIGNGTSVSTPGVNPDAVGAEMSSSMKPISKEGERKQDESVILPPKKSTQESAPPLAVPMEGVIGQIPGPPDPAANTIHRPNTQHDQPDSGVREDHAAEVHDNHVGPLNPVANAIDERRLFVPESAWAQRRDPNNAVEEDEEAEPRNYIRQRDNAEIPRPGKSHAEHYHGGDYDKEQPEEEAEDDEGEQMDYIQGNDPIKKDDQLKQPGLQHLKHVESHNDGGVMVNPK